MDKDEKIRKLSDFCDNQKACEFCPIQKHQTTEFGCYFLEMKEDEIQELYGIAFPDEPVDMVNHPPHYQGKHECIDEMIALFGIEAVKSFCRCNAYKYRYRADKKNGSEDIAKCEWYMCKLMELENQTK